MSGRSVAAGLLGGIGRGLVANAETKTKENFAALEEARDIRLRQLDAQIASQAQAKQFENQKELETQRAGNQSALQDKEGQQRLDLFSKESAARSAEQEAERTFRREENAKDRATNLSIADTRMKSNIGRGFKPDKFTTTTVKATRLGGKNGNIPEEYETVAVTRGGQTFVQLGQNFVPYRAGEPAVEPAFKNQAAVQQALKKLNKDNASTFLRLFGFIPADYIKYVARGDESPFGASQTEDDEE